MVTLSDRIRNFPVLNALMIMLLSLLILQVIAYLVGLVYTPATQIKLGWVFLLLAIAISVWFSVQIIERRISGIITRPFVKEEIFVLVLIMVGVIAILVFVPKLVPEAFNQAVLQLQSIVGLP